jgi:hypothetical protein
MIGDKTNSESMARDIRAARAEKHNEVFGI